MDDVALPFAKFRLSDRSRHAAAQICDHLRSLILSLELKPGAPLSRHELQQAYGVSSTPVRDALIRLQEEDLVEIYPQHTTLVSRIDIAQARQAHFMRRSIELEIARVLALQPDPAMRVRLGSIVALQQRLAETGDYSGFNEADAAFHRETYAAAGVADLFAVVRRMSGHIDRIRRLHLPVEGRSAEIISDHLAIADAMAAGDVQAAQTAVREHLSRSIAMSTDMRKSMPEYFRP